MSDKLFPALVEALKERIEACQKRYEKEKEEEEQDLSMRDAGKIPLVPEATGQNKHDTAPVLPQSSQIVPLVDKPESLDVTQIDAQPDSQGQPDINSPTLEEHALFVASGNTEALGLISSDSIPQSETGVRDTKRNKIEEVLSTLESEKEGSWIAQRKDKLW